MSEIEPVEPMSDLVESTLEKKEELLVTSASDELQKSGTDTAQEAVTTTPCVDVVVALVDLVGEVESAVVEAAASQDEVSAEDISSLEEHPDNVHSIHVPVEEVASMSIDQSDPPVHAADDVVVAAADAILVESAVAVGSVSEEESDVPEPTPATEDTPAEQAPATSVDAQNSPDNATSTKPKKLGGKQRKALAKRLAAEKAPSSVDVVPSSTAVVSAAEPAGELLSPEEQHRAARLVKTNAESAVSAVEGSGSSIATEVAQARKKKPTSSERRAIRDAKRAAAEAIGTVEAGTDGASKVEEKKVGASDASATVSTADGSVEAKKKLSSKQRKAKARREATEKEKETAPAEAAAVVVVPAVKPTAAVSTSMQPTSSAEDKPEKKKKMGSRERKALKLAREAAELAALNTTTTASTTAPAQPVMVEATTETGSDATPTKTRKLNSKQRKAKKRAAEAAAEAEAAQAAATLAALATAPAVAVENTKKEKKQKPAKPVGETTSNSPAAVTVPTAKETKPAPSKLVAKTETTDKKVAQDGKKMLADSPSGPPISSVATIALHGVLASLRQGLLSRDSVIYTQQSAMKMHLLTEVCKLGCECVEGSASNFQFISWSASGQCLTYTSAVVNAPAQYPAGLKSKGDLKLVAPALSLRLKCYPAFGAGSPALIGVKSFREGFIRSVLEVKLGQTDSFVFVMPLQVYIDYAWEAMGSLPAVRDIKRHFGECNTAYGLRALCCTVETAYGEFVIGCVVVA